MKRFYFEAFEDRRPEPPERMGVLRSLLFRYLVVLHFCVMAWYLHWRWTDSLNPEALWFSIPMALTETLASLGGVLLFLNLWGERDPGNREAPETVNGILRPRERLKRDRSLMVDVFIPTRRDDPDLVAFTVQDVLQMRYPHPIDLRVRILDDGSDPEMEAMAKRYGIGYIGRTDRKGGKAGCLKNALDQTAGDLVVMFAADARPFPGFLEQTLGHFRDPDVAWVQTPQWFYDLEEGIRLPEALFRIFWWPGRIAGRALELVLGDIRLGKDPFGNAGNLFHACMLRRRMYWNAVFSCGAGGIHRREVLMRAALIRFGKRMEGHIRAHIPSGTDASVANALRIGLQRGYLMKEEIRPYEHHVTEDVHTALLLHADTEHRWRSVHHPEVLVRRLSPRNMKDSLEKKFRRAAGSFELLRAGNPLTEKGLGFGQRLMYFQSIYLFLSSLWSVVFFLAPVLFLATGISPFATFDRSCILHLLVFLLSGRLAYFIGTLGVDTRRDLEYQLVLFPVYLKALGKVLFSRAIETAGGKDGAKRGLAISWFQTLLALANLSAMGMAGVRIWTGTGLAPGMALACIWCAWNVRVLGVFLLASWRRELPLYTTTAERAVVTT